MKFLNEFRDDKRVLKLAEKIKQTVTKPWKVMEICGGQTRTIIKYGLHALLPQTVDIIHGPGCPVCVTSVSIIDKAIAIAAEENVILCTFADMLRVPGSQHDLLAAKASGALIKTIYSPLEAVALAEKEQDKKIVFFAIGFETTAPANAMALYLAKKKKLGNFFALVSHTLVPAAMNYLLSTDQLTLQGFLAAGHVCTVMGLQQYYPIAQKYKVPIVITGFEPVDILQGLLNCVSQLEKGSYQVSNQYKRCVNEYGNPQAQSLVASVFAPVEQDWRGIAVIPQSGFQLRPEYQSFDAARHFSTREPPACRLSGKCQSGAILLGKIKPPQCSEFAKKCTPESPLGAPMVSHEGACHSYYHFRDHE